jgi:hypothetical protein
MLTIILKNVKLHLQFLSKNMFFYIFVLVGKKDVSYGNFKKYQLTYKNCHQMKNIDFIKN